MNYFQILQIATQIASTISAAEAKRLNGTEAVKYFAARTYAARLEDQNPGISELTGFSQPIPR